MTTRKAEAARFGVHDKARIGQLARAVTSMIAWHGGALSSVLDVGAGAGLWRDWFAKHKPKSKYRSIEVSAYACERYGHEQRDITTWCARERFDLIVCQGVLQYIPDGGADAAIVNLGTMARGFLYLEATSRAPTATCTCERRSGTASGSLATSRTSAAASTTRAAVHFSSTSSSGDSARARHSRTANFK
jgi:hypothetical protein